MDPDRWRLFLLDVEGCVSSIYLMMFGAHIPLSGVPFLHDPSSFPKLKQWQQAAALEVVYQYIKEGKVLVPFRVTLETALSQGDRCISTLPLWYQSLNQGVTDRSSMLPTIGVGRV